MTPEALDRWLRHGPTCRLLGGLQDSEPDDDRCTCGLLAARAEATAGPLDVERVATEFEDAARRWREDASGSRGHWSSMCGYDDNHSDVLATVRALTFEACAQQLRAALALAQPAPAGGTERCGWCGRQADHEPVPGICGGPDEPASAGSCTGFTPAPVAPVAARPASPPASGLAEVER